MKLGAFEIYPVSDGRFALDGGAMFGVVPKVLWERCCPADELNRIPLSITALLIRAHAKVSLHFHDTYGMAVANVLAAWTEYGISSFDTSAGGLGGCPYAPGASGNVATEDVVYALRASGASVPVDERLVVNAAQQVGAVLNHPLSSRLSSLYQRHTTYEAVR